MKTEDFKMIADAVIDKVGLDLYHSSTIRPDIADQLELAYKMGIQQCWDAVNDHIASGPLPGNGTDKTAERNGLILATNIISEIAS